MKHPKVSIITSVFNGEEYLEETILSVLNQSYDNIEYIIIDGGSTDKSVDIIKKYEDRLAYWISEKDNGMYDGIAKGFSHATGEICAYINSDDFYQPTAIQTVVNIMTERPEIKWLSGMQTLYNTHSTIVNAFMQIPQSSKQIRKRYFPIQQEVTFWRSELHKSIDWERFKSFRLAGDYYMWFCFSSFAEHYVVRAILSGFRRHGKQLSANYEAYQKELDTFCLKKNVIDVVRQKIMCVVFFKFPRMFWRNKYMLKWDYVSNKYV